MLCTRLDKGYRVFIVHDEKNTFFHLAAWLNKWWNLSLSLASSAVRIATQERQHFRRKASFVSFNDKDFWYSMCSRTVSQSFILACSGPRSVLSAKKIIIRLVSTAFFQPLVAVSILDLLRTARKKKFLPDITDWASILLRQLPLLTWWQ